MKRFIRQTFRAIAIMTMVAVPVSGEVINEGFKILAADGEADNEFGASVVH